jgi:hypothetical protein
VSMGPPSGQRGPQSRGCVVVVIVTSNVPTRVYAVVVGGGRLCQRE